MRYLACLSFLLALMACSKTLPAPAEEVETQGGELTIAVNERATLDKSYSLAFLNVSEDSRCPPGVTCVWEGRAVLTLGLESEGQSLETLELTIQAGRPEMAAGDLGGYRLTVLDLTPFSMGSDGTAPDYRVKVMAEKK